MDAVIHADRGPKASGNASVLVVQASARAAEAIRMARIEPPATVWRRTRSSQRPSEMVDGTPHARPRSRSARLRTRMIRFAGEGPRDDPDDDVSSRRLHTL